MCEAAQRFDRRHAGVAPPQRVAQHLAALLVAIEEQVLLAGEVVEHRHAPDVRGFRDLVHRHGVEAALEEQPRRRVGDGLPRGEAFSGPPVGER